MSQHTIRIVREPRHVWLLAVALRSDTLRMSIAL